MMMDFIQYGDQLRPVIRGQPEHDMVCVELYNIIILDIRHLYLHRGQF